MHIEIDVWEIAFLIFAYMVAKWLFRVLVLVVVGKVIGQMKKKGIDAIEQAGENLKRKFKNEGNDEGDL